MKRVLVKFSTLATWNTRVVRSAGAADGAAELRAPKEKLVELGSDSPRLRSSTEWYDGGDTVEMSRDSGTARIHGVRCRVGFSKVRRRC